MCYNICNTYCERVIAMTNVSNYKKFVEAVPVGERNRGKYYLAADDGTKYTLQLYNIKAQALKMQEFRHMQNVAGLGIAMPMPIELGAHGDGFYILTGQIEGQNLQTAQLTCGARYMLGIKAGEILRKIHTLDAPAGDWQTNLITEVDSAIEAYYRSNLLIPGMEKILDFIEQNKYLLTFVRPGCYLHGDFAEYNLAINNYELMVAEFGGTVQAGDPWYDFSRLIRGDQSASFATGVLRGYFAGKEPPTDFWPLATLYTCIDALKLTILRHRKAPNRLQLSLAHIANIVKWHKGMTDAVPSWYRPNGAEVTAELQKCDSNAADALIALSEFTFPGVTPDVAIPNAVLLLIDRLPEHNASSLISAYYLGYAYHSISNDEYFDKAIEIVKSWTLYEDTNVGNACGRVSALVLIAMLQVAQKGMDEPEPWLTKLIRNHELWLKQNGGSGICTHVALLLCEGYPY